MLVFSPLSMWACLFICVFVYSATRTSVSSDAMPSCSFLYVCLLPSLKVKKGVSLYLCIFLFVYLWICVFLYLCICEFVYFCICVFVYSTTRTKVSSDAALSCKFPLCLSSPLSRGGCVSLFVCLYMKQREQKSHLTRRCLVVSFMFVSPPFS